MMKAYIVVTETVNDQAMFDAYRKEVPATLTPFGGEFVVRGGTLTILEGVRQHPRLGNHRVSITASCRGLVQVGSVSEGDRAPAEEHHQQHGHRRRTGIAPNGPDSLRP